MAWNQLVWDCNTTYITSNIVSIISISHCYFSITITYYYYPSILLVYYYHIISITSIFLSHDFSITITFLSVHPGMPRWILRTTPPLRRSGSMSSACHPTTKLGWQRLLKQQKWWLCDFYDDSMVIKMDWSFFPKQFTAGVLDSFLNGCPALSRWCPALPMSSIHLSPSLAGGARLSRCFSFFVLLYLSFNVPGGVRLSLSLCA